MRDHDVLGLTALMLGFCGAALLVPDVTAALLVEPTFGAVLGAAALVTVIVVLRARGRRGSALERRCLAVFLALMPTVYLSSWLRHPTHSGAHSGGDTRWLAIELGGQLVFAVLAVLGARWSPWILALGIATHGLLWDSWHFGRTPYIADWYVVACMVVDVAFGLYVATQARAYARESAAARVPPAA